MNVNIQITERTVSSVRIFIRELDYTDYGFWVAYEDLVQIFGDGILAEVKQDQNTICKTIDEDLAEKIISVGINPYYNLE